MTRLQIALVVLALFLIGLLFLRHTPDSWLAVGGSFAPRDQLLLISEP